MVDLIASVATPSCEVALQSRVSRWRRYLGALLCIGVSGLFLYLVVRRVDLVEVRKALAGANLRWLAPMVMVSLVDFWLRTVRWTSMFPPEARPTTQRAFSAFVIGTMTNNLVPGRLGDVTRGAMIGRIVPLLGTSGAVATVVLEKVVDGLMFLVLLGTAFLIAPLPAWLQQVGALGSLIFLGTLLLLLAANAHSKGHRTTSNIAAKESRFGKRVWAMRRLLQRFAFGLTALSSKRQAMVVLTLTLPIWLLEFFMLFLVFQMFGMNLPFTAAMITAVLLTIGMMVRRLLGSSARTNFSQSPVCNFTMCQRTRLWP